MPHHSFGERFLGRRKPAWHRFGRVCDDSQRSSRVVGQLNVFGTHLNETRQGFGGAASGQCIIVWGG